MFVCTVVLLPVCRCTNSLTFSAERASVQQHPNSNWHSYSLDPDFYIAFFTKRQQGSLKKWLNPGPRQERYKMSLDHLLVPENKKKLKKLWRESKGNRRSLQKLPLPRFGTNVIGKNCNPLNKMRKL